MDDDRLEALLDELDIELAPDLVARDLEPLVQAIAGGARPAKLTAEARKAAAMVWSDELAAAVRTGFEELRAEAEGQLRSIDEALAELERPARENQVARALVFRSALELLVRGRRNIERVAELEHKLHTAPAEEHRALTLRLAEAAIDIVEIDALAETRAAVDFLESFPENWEDDVDGATHATHELARALATEERREHLRTALAQLADLSTEAFPLSARALTALLEEPMPRDPADDDLWVNFVVSLAAEHRDAFEFARHLR